MPCLNDYQNITSYEIWEEMVLFHIGKGTFKNNSLWLVAHCLLFTFQILKHLQITKKSRKWKFINIKTLPIKFHYFSIVHFSLVIFHNWLGARFYGGQHSLRLLLPHFHHEWYSPILIFLIDALLVPWSGHAQLTSLSNECEKKPSLAKFSKEHSWKVLSFVKGYLRLFQLP
jgi:hypothetical protein